MLLAATDDDVPFLRDAILVEAAFPAGTRPPTDAVADDHIVRYIEGWGRTGDLGLVAWGDRAPVGASWTRLMAPDRPGYGFVDATTPELTVAVVAEHRGTGVGRALVAGALDLAGAHGFARVSLSVADAVNPVAVNLYRSLGFEEVGRDAGGSLTMIASTAPPPPSTPTTVAHAPPHDPAGAARPASPRARAATPADGPALARLREVMFAHEGLGDQPGWVAPFLARWAEDAPTGRMLGAVVDDERGRPVASALASVSAVVPGPGRFRGRGAHVGSVATEPGWRQRGCARAAVTALVDALDAAGVESSTLTASPDGADLYTSLGFVRSRGAAMRRNGPG